MSADQQLPSGPADVAAEARLSACHFRLWSIATTTFVNTLWVKEESHYNLDDFQNSFTDKFTDKVAAQLAPIIPSHLKYAAILPRETLILENEQQSKRCLVIQDKSQGNVASCLRCSGLFSHFTTNLLLSFLVKQILKSWTFGKGIGKKVDCLTRSVYIEHEQFTINFTYEIQELLLTVVMLVSPMVLSFVIININVM